MRGSRNRLLVPAIVTVGVGLLVAGLGGTPLRGDRAPESPAEVRPNPASPGGAIHALAHLEPATGFVSVGARPGSRIDAIRVKDGDPVKAGDLLAILEGRDQAERQLAVAQAKKKDADRQRSLRRDRLALERVQFDRLKEPRLDAAHKSAGLARQRRDELSELSKKFSQTLATDPKLKSELDQAQSQAELAVIKAELDEQEVRAQQDLQPKLRSLEDRELADDGPGQELLDRQIDLAKGVLAETEIRSPISGHVLDVLAHVGEVSSGPLVLLGDDSAVVAKAEVYQSDVPRIQTGDPVEVRILDHTVRGNVVRIARTVGRNELKSLDPRALQDLRVVRVTIALEDSALASRFLNMQVDVTIRPRRDAR